MSIKIYIPTSNRSILRIRYIYHRDFYKNFLRENGDNTSDNLTIFKLYHKVLAVQLVSAPYFVLKYIVIKDQVAVLMSSANI